MNENPQEGVKACFQKLDLVSISIYIGISNLHILACRKLWKYIYCRIFQELHHEAPLFLPHFHSVANREISDNQLRIIVFHPVFGRPASMAPIFLLSQNCIRAPLQIFLLSAAAGTQIWNKNQVFLITFLLAVFCWLIVGCTCFSIDYLLYAQHCLEDESELIYFQALQWNQWNKCTFPHLWRTYMIISYRITSLMICPMGIAQCSHRSRSYMICPKWSAD